MSRIVTSSEVDRLHQQVAELQSQVKDLLVIADVVKDQLLLPSPAQTPASESELFDASQFLSDVEPPSGGARAAADSIVNEIAGN